VIKKATIARPDYFALNEHKAISSAKLLL
jgi:hypothetical protein